MSDMLDDILGNEIKKVSFTAELIELFDGNLNICSLRNYFSSHEQAKSSFDSSISTAFPEWSNKNEKEIFSIASLFFTKVQIFLRRLQGSPQVFPFKHGVSELEGSHSGNPQVFPFKLTFTAYSITDQGIHICHYRTDMHTDAAAKNKIIKL